MQQPLPGGQSPRPRAPGQRVPGPPPVGYRPATPAAPAPVTPADPGQAAAVAATLAALAAVRPRSRPLVRFAGSTCITTAWITLILSIVSAVGTFAIPVTLGPMVAAASRASQPSTLGAGGSPDGVPDTSLLPGPGGLPSPSALLRGDSDSGGFSLPMPSPVGGFRPSAMIASLGPLLTPVCVGTGVLTLVSGVVFFFILLGLGQACHAVTDTDKRLAEVQATLLSISARLPAGR